MTSQPAAVAFRPDRPTTAHAAGDCPTIEQRPSGEQPLQRSSGEIDVAFAAPDPARGGATRPTRMFQSGCAKLRFPRQHGGMEPTGVVINTAGGLTGGDRFTLSATLADSAAATLTTQAAEKVYRSTGGAALVGNAIALGTGARLDWLPQETILFDASALDRGTEVAMAPDASLTAVEMLVFGRAAMGERMTSGSLRDRWRVRRGGRLVFADTTRLDGPVAERLGHPATAADGTATALLLHVAPEAESRLAMVRELLRQAPAVRAGASAFDGLLVARLVAPGGAELRSLMLQLLAGLRDGLPPPRAWMI